MRGRRRPVEPWRRRALAQREAGREKEPGAGADAGSTFGEPREAGAPIAPSPLESSPAAASSSAAPSLAAPPENGDHPARGRSPLSMSALPPETPSPPVRERRRGPRFNLITGTLLLSAIALLGGFLVINLVLMPSFTRQGAEVPVPEITGLSEREAERMLAREDLRLSKVSEQWSPDVPRGFIVAQDPDAGGLVKRGRRISVVVSLGAQGTSVPVLDGMSDRQASIQLESAGLRRGKVARVYTDDIGKDLVIATDPPGETVVEQETVVDLLVSLGPPPRGFVLPDLTGKDGTGTARGLRDEGFAVAVRPNPSSRGPSDAVIGQDPAPGHRIAPRDSIVLYVNP